MLKELKFTDGTTLPIGTMYGIGRNYSKHAREMGGNVPDEPIIFIKPPAAYIEDGESIILPSISDNVHYEVELVVVIGKYCKNISKIDAHKYIAGYAVGIDATLRDLQAKAKKEGNPWAVAKGFYTSAPISKIVPALEFNSINPVFDISLKINGEIRQKASTADMERSVAVLVEYLSQIFTLQVGECIFTGTPEGVGQINKGDKIFAELEGLVSMSIDVI